MSKSIAIIDYGLGNVHSVCKAVELCAPGWKITLTSNPNVLSKADKLVFPGVGAIADCMAGLSQLNLLTDLPHLLTSKPSLAICVGFQALFSVAYEGGAIPCLNLMHSEVEHIDSLARRQSVDMQAELLRVPHCGWNELHISNGFKQHDMFKGIDDSTHVYFVHSYAVAAQDQEFCAATAHHGTEIIACSILDQLIGCQFHPEKSHACGQKILQNFVAL